MTKKSLNKVLVQYLNNENNIIKEAKYNSLTAVAKDLKIDYFQLYAVYQFSMKTKVRKMQPYILNLTKEMRIIDNPEYFKITLPIIDVSTEEESN